jgi:hypothetical protein
VSQIVKTAGHIGDPLLARVIFPDAESNLIAYDWSATIRAHQDQEKSLAR